MVSETPRQVAERIIRDWHNAEISPKIADTEPLTGISKSLADAIEAALNAVVEAKGEQDARLVEAAEPPDYEYGLMESGWNDAAVHFAAVIRNEGTKL